jgi:hypothetical protein
MLRHVALVRTDVSEELVAVLIRLTRIGGVVMDALGSSETMVLTRATRRNIPEDGILRLRMFALLMGFIGLGVGKLQVRTPDSGCTQRTNRCGTR